MNYLIMIKTLSSTGRLLVSVRHATTAPLPPDQYKTPKFQKGFITYRGEGLSPSWLPLSAWPPGRCSAPLSSSWRGCVSPPAGKRDGAVSLGPKPRPCRQSTYPPPPPFFQSYH